MSQRLIEPPAIQDGMELPSLLLGRQGLGVSLLRGAGMILGGMAEDPLGTVVKVGLGVGATVATVLMGAAIIPAVIAGTGLMIGIGLIGQAEEAFSPETAQT